MILWTASVFPQPFLSLCNGPINKVAMVGEMVIHELLCSVSKQHGLPITKAHLARAASEYQVCQQQRLTLNPRYGTTSQVYYIGPLPLQKRQHSILSGVGT